MKLRFSILARSAARFYEIIGSTSDAQFVLVLASFVFNQQTVFGAASDSCNPVAQTFVAPQLSLMA